MDILSKASSTIVEHDKIMEEMVDPSNVLDQEKLAELEYCFAPDAKIVLMGCSNAKKNYWSNEDNLMKSVSKALPGRRVYAPKEDCNVINPKFYKTGLLKTVQFQWWDDMEGKSIRNLSASICQR